jgi:glycerophosphoryl diester phosphodiesterase
MIQLASPILFAHRGASAHAPENTLAAFQLAAEHFADAIELDAKLSSDGVVVVMHDATVKRTTGGDGRVSHKTLAQLKAYDAGSWFSAQYAGERIPTLDEVFEHMGRRLLINVELTNYTSPNDALVDGVVELVRKHQLEEWVIFSSFHPVNLLKARRLLPEVPVAVLALEGKAGALSRSRVGRWISPHFIHPYVSDVNHDWLEKQHAYGRKVNVWTVNNPDQMRSLFRWGVDGIFTDDPRLARTILEEGA